MGNTMKAADAAMSGFSSKNPNVMQYAGMIDSTKNLSDMEVGCLVLHSDGHDCKFVSERYNFSEITVRMILDSARKKLNASNLSHATKIAIRMGLIKL